MKEWPLPAEATVLRNRDGIVLVALGEAAESGQGSQAPLADVTRRLAELSKAPVLALATQADPDAALRGIAEQAEHCEPGWLAGLEIDVGLALEDGRCWAEVLGAWRQPALLVIPAAQLTSGVPAAATALLRYWQVPLLGLLQWGGAWQPEARLRDGLPWLGRLAQEERGDAALESESAQLLAAALALRWRQLDRP